ncbi:MAG TPA: hypothetical protein DDZ91_07185, partial [Firmicutes bacterium]|nr:hypothetical protein [Bacillota bacterium]
MPQKYIKKFRAKNMQRIYTQHHRNDVNEYKHKSCQSVINIQPQKQNNALGQTSNLKVGGSNPSG